jgi:hypothetical protein
MWVSLQVRGLRRLRPARAVLDQGSCLNSGTSSIRADGRVSVAYAARCRQLSSALGLPIQYPPSNMAQEELAFHQEPGISAAHYPCPQG